MKLDGFFRSVIVYFSGLDTIIDRGAKEEDVYVCPYSSRSVCSEECLRSSDDLHCKAIESLKKLKKEENIKW